MAVDATGTATSPDGIPTFNTAADNPSGKGANNIVAAIQTAFNNKVAKPAGVATGDVPVWNGSGWVVPSGSRTGAKFLRDDGSWQLVAGAVNYRKATAKAVNNTVAATDLLNGEITVAANAMGATGVLRLTAWGDRLDNVAANAPRFQLVFGGTTFLDTNSANGSGASAGRTGWKIVAEIMNYTASSQVCSIWYQGQSNTTPGTQGENGFTTGEGFHSFRFLDIHAVGTNTGLTVNTTSAQALALNVINGTASASYETKLFGALVEII